MKDLSTPILTKAEHCFQTARLNILQGAEYLHKISKGNLWDGTYSSFGEFVQTKCQISESYASKLVKTYDHFVVQGGLSHAKLTGVDPEKLYLSISLKGTPEQQALKAEMWSRQEIKSELASKDGHDCEHPTVIKICSSCHARV